MPNFVMKKRCSPMRVAIPIGITSMCIE